jgi:hypothetical protein
VSPLEGTLIAHPPLGDRRARFAWRASRRRSADRKEFEVTKTTTLIAAFASGLAAVAIAGGGIATAGTAGKPSGNQLAGTWSVTINRPAPMPPLSSLQVYTDAGSMVESGDDTAARAPQYGSWKRIAGRKYAATSVIFLFNPQTDAFTAKAKINRTINLSNNGTSFTFHGRATIDDPNGKVQASFPVSGSGQRLRVQGQS